MIRNKWVLGATALTLATAVVGCSQKSDNSANKSASSSPGAASPSAASPTAKQDDDKSKKYTIKSMYSTYGQPTPITGPGITAVNEKFNVDLQSISIPNAAYEEKYSAMMASGDLPDILHLKVGDLKGRYRDFARQGAFLPLDDYIDKYPNLKAVPKSTWDLLRVDGKIYGFPRYNTRLGSSIYLRKDWLDNLGLKVPTNYDELKQVAIAFAKNDPDKNGKNDTYGLAMGANFAVDYNMGPYWSSRTWYNKDKDGNLIPGYVSDAWKKQVQWFADLYKEGAISPDFVTLNGNDINKQFYEGRAGIFSQPPNTLNDALLDPMLKIQPNAKFVALQPFTDPNGVTALESVNPLSGMKVLNAKLKSDPGKVNRILSMWDQLREFIPNSQWGPQNADFDWRLGKNGTGYDWDATTKKYTLKPNFDSLGLLPFLYFDENLGFPKKDTDVDFVGTYTHPQLQDLAKQLTDIHAKTQHYANPTGPYSSKTEDAKKNTVGTLFVEQQKMVAGQRPLSDWDKIVKDWMDAGGSEIIKEYNEQIKEKDVKKLLD
ncbi:extracellular solute-binding protein [Paenibacillus cymbidii]|uniref:extracellular solute-binding protein n=1 Tax=Paenibacillus cymbidii TaxID=1639034 RepID=UPI001436758D|nr:extracellular solute-binding protein [Paenibacillus cymbidii]